MRTGEKLDSVISCSNNSFLDSLFASLAAHCRSDDMGGSSHGIIEVYYRLNAFRMKVFLRASVTEDVNTIMKALDLIHPGNLAGSVDKLRENALATVVELADAFSKCRKRTNQYFHR